jgi:NhaA family Na+:H+ antiporter
MEPSEPNHPPEVWEPARRAAARLVSPLQRVLEVEAAGGLLLVLAAAAALICANSPWQHGYHALWETPVGGTIGSWSFVRPLHFWVNDGLMTIFFFLVGLEIRREVYEGELGDLRRAALPFAAALGGMVVPGLLYALLNTGHAGSAGWAIPMATDIAFAVGVLTLIGERVPPAQRILLLALAVVDDIGAIIVIAIFYSGGVSPLALLVSAAGMAGIFVMRWIGLRQPIAYVVPGLVVWSGLHAAGVHPALAGVMLGLVTPVRTWFGAAGFAEATQAHLGGLGDGADRDELHARLGAIERARREAISPSERLQRLIHPWVAYGVMPLFALANAGVGLGGADLRGDAGLVFLGIVIGLVLGKPIGIVAASVVATRSGLAHAGDELGRRGIALVGVVGGIGFTVSLFVAQLAFPSGPLLVTAKLAILVGSTAAALLGLTLGLLGHRRRLDGRQADRR